MNFCSQKRKKVWKLIFFLRSQYFNEPLTKTVFSLKSMSIALSSCHKKHTSRRFMSMWQLIIYSMELFLQSCKRKCRVGRRCVNDSRQLCNWSCYSIIKLNISSLSILSNPLVTSSRIRWTIWRSNQDWAFKECRTSPREAIRSFQSLNKIKTMYWKSLPLTRYVPSPNGNFVVCRLNMQIHKNILN